MEVSVDIKTIFLGSPRECEIRVSLGPSKLASDDFTSPFCFCFSLSLSTELLSKSLLALLRLSLNRKLGFVLPPSHFAPEAKLLIAEEDRSSTWGETKERYTSLQELAGQIDNEELDRFIMDGRVR